MNFDRTKEICVWLNIEAIVLQRLRPALIKLTVFQGWGLGVESTVGYHCMASHPFNVSQL